MDGYARGARAFSTVDEREWGSLDDYIQVVYNYYSRHQSHVKVNCYYSEEEDSLLATLKLWQLWTYIEGIILGITSKWPRYNLSWNFLMVLFYI